MFDMEPIEEIHELDEEYEAYCKEQALKEVIMTCHNAALNAGWWTDLATGAPTKRPVPELLCLIHSEVSEALEGYRKGLKDDKLPHRDALEVELADAVIRIFDMAGGYGLDLSGALFEKLEYNRRREDHKIEHRRQDGGKKL